MDENIQLLDISKRFGTPTYVYYEKKIRRNYRTISSAFKSRYENSRILYAMKANPSLAICHILKQEGSGADVVSEGELMTAQKVGIEKSKIIFTNNSKTDRELEVALDAGVIINIDSMAELIRLKKITEKKGKTADISFRVNPSIDPKTNPKIATGLKESKFGIHLEKGLALDAYREAKKSRLLSIVGVHTHVGSQIINMQVFKETAEKVMSFVSELKKELDITLKFIDFGGGLGVSYTGEPVPTAEEYAEAITSVAKKWIPEIGYKPEVWVEPGRYIVCNAGVLLCSVTGVKETPYKKFINLDAGFNVLIRPAMYDAYHKVSVLNRVSEECTECYDVVGNICESGDVFAKNRKLPNVQEGDIIAIYDVGAYGYSMSSQYNQRPRPAEVLIRDDKAEVIREREKIDDLFRNQRVPDELLK